MKTAVSFRLSAIGCWLLAVGCWLLAIGYWLLVISYRYLKDSKDFRDPKDHGGFRTMYP